MVGSGLRAADPSPDVALVHTGDGKATRAYMVALLFEAERVWIW